MVTWSDNPPERPAPGTEPRPAWSRFFEAVGLLPPGARQPGGMPPGGGDAVRKLSGHQAQALAALGEADQTLAALQADGVPDDDPRFMEALAQYEEAGAMLALGPDSPAFVIVQKGADVSAYVTEPEAN